MVNGFAGDRQTMRPILPGASRRLSHMLPIVRSITRAGVTRRGHESSQPVQSMTILQNDPRAGAGSGSVERLVRRS